MAAARTISAELGVLPERYLEESFDAVVIDELPAPAEVQAAAVTYKVQFAKQGKDWEAELRQRARELALMEELGITAAPSVPAGETAPGPNDQPADGPADEEANDEPDL